MQAAILWGVNEAFEVTEVELEGPREGEVRVRLVASGVCHSDLSIQRGTLPLKPPLIIGHEGAGVVEEVGPGVRSVRPGDPVVLTWLTSCGLCRDCARARPHLCRQAARLINAAGKMPDGTTRFRRGDREVPHWVGSFAEQTIVPEAAVIPIRKEVPLEVAALVGCGVMTGMGAVWNTARVEPGALVAVFGCGGVGLSAIQAASVAGAEKVIAIDLAPAKLELARSLGATHVIDASQENPVKVVQEITGGGAEYAFEVIGSTAVIQQAFAATRPGGKCVVVGVPPRDSELTLPAFALPMAEKSIIGSYYGSPRFRADIPMILDLYMAGRVKLDALITQRIALGEINEAFARMERGEGARSVIRYGG